MNHFFLPASCFGGEMITFPLQVSKQIASVLRLKPDERVVALDNRENAYLIELVDVSSKCVTGRVVDTYYELPAEPSLKLTLFVAVTQREKFELILQKCTELGASSFVPVIFSRSLVQSIIEVEAKRERWEAILREAAEQCGRLLIPTLQPAMKWLQAVKVAHKRYDENLVLWENEKRVVIDNVFCFNPYAENVSLFIGPEGGITDEEIKAVEGEHMSTVSLGPRILRMETAAIAATTIIMERFGCLMPNNEEPDDEPSGEDIPF